VTSGISAADRARTVRVAVDPQAKPGDLVTPGHVFPLRAKRGGVLVRTGHTEGSVDLAELAGLTPAGVICEIMNDDGTMARMPDLEAFAKTHDLRLLTIADLIQYRLQTERLVKRASEATLKLDATGTEWLVVAFDIVGEGRQFLALVKGDVAAGGAVLARIHTGSLLGDVFASTPSDGGANLRESLRMIEAEGRGIVLYIPPRGDLLAELERRLPTAAVPERASKPTLNVAPLREFGLGAQVLAELGILELRLLSNSQTKIAGLDGFGLKIVERIPIVAKD
jgi:3,4-dihydroxy 2-butanone 4-phosphate synthase/GTP cyclohydrolase II